MKLLLLINEEPIREWDIDIPPEAKHLNEYAKFLKYRKDLIADKIAAAKEECECLIGNKEYHFVIQHRASVQPGDALPLGVEIQAKDGETPENGTTGRVISLPVRNPPQNPNKEDSKFTTNTKTS